MTAAEALQALAEFIADDPDLEAATVAKPLERDGPPEARALNLAGDAEDFFRELLDAAVADRIEDWTLKKLEVIYKPDPDELEWDRTADIEAIQAAVDRYSNVSPLPPFSPGDEAYKSRLQYWVCVLTGSDGRKAYFFRSFSASAELQRKRLGALVSKNGTFQLVKDRIFLFDEAVDAFVFEGYLFVISKTRYRRIFDQLEQVRRRARAAARALHDKVPIKNFDEFADACGTQAAMADKIVAVQQRDYFDQLSYQMLAPVMKEFSLEIPVETISGKKHLIFRPEPAHRFRILKLIDDDYLKSSMTNHRYEVNSKTEPP